jgi:hypothetical protein
LGCLVSASHFRRGTNDSLGKAGCNRLKHGCDHIRVKTSLGDIESILESILFARFENYEKFLPAKKPFYGFAFIAGYTAGGAPYGITIEEAVSLTNADLSYSDATPYVGRRYTLLG